MMMMKIMIIIRKKYLNFLYDSYMDNIIDTFKINKSIINEDELLKTNESNDNLEMDLIIKKKKLIDMSSNLNKIEYHEILNIIQKDNCTFSSNSNGVFINLINVENHTIDKVFNFLKFTKQKKEELKEKENYLENFKKNINIEEKKNTETNNNINNNINNNVKIINNEDNKSLGSLSEDEDNINYNDYLCFSSDEEDNKNIKK